MALAEIRPGNDRGRFDETYRWEVSVREAPEYTGEDPKHELDIKSDVLMYEIEVSVLWPQSADREGVYSIHTLRLAPRASS
jgi:hypothetical protein